MEDVRSKVGWVHAPGPLRVQGVMTVGQRTRQVRREAKDASTSKQELALESLE